MAQFITKYQEQPIPNPPSFNIPKEKIFIKLGGEKKVNAYDRIQASNVDVDIYETLEKYNMAPTLANVAQIIPQTEIVMSDLRQISEFEHPQDYIDHANKLWEQLPLEVRAEFNHDVKNFCRNAENWVKNDLKNFTEKIIKKQQKIQKQITDTPTDTSNNQQGVKDNE